MIKKIIVAVLVLFVIGFASWKIFFSKSDFDKTFRKVQDTLTAYHIEGTMDVDSGDDTRSYFITTDYQKTDDTENYRVSLLDKGLNQEQIIIKNTNGVFVLTPTLNQVYTFEGDWPLNSPKPYLYHSILDAFEGKHDMKKMDDGYLVSFKPKYENAPTWTHEDVKLSSDLKPLWVNVYDSNDNVVVKVVFSEVNFAPTFEANHFEVKQNMETSRSTLSSTTMSTKEDLPLYPSGIDLAVSLTDSTLTSINGTETYVLRYAGENYNFTITQKIASPSSEMVTDKTTSCLIEVGGALGLYDMNYVSYYNNGIIYQVYSTTLPAGTMLEIAAAMEMVAAK